MKFQLLKLVIWPKSEEFAPREIEFEPGKLNVITGASRTGKSAIIPIIDYCLASSDCFIPIDTIRDHASWYGVVFQTDGGKILLARRVPQGNKVSDDFFLLRGSSISIPPTIPEANEKSAGIKHILNTIASVPYFSLDGGESVRPYQARLGFRDLMALVFQNQDLVANHNILFYKSHSHEHRERLRNWFPFILGAENIDVLKARQRLQEVEKKLTQLKRELEKAKAVSSSWMANMLGHIKIAEEYGLVEGDFSETTEAEDLLAVAKSVLENMPEHSKTSFKNIEDANDEISELEAEEETISSEVALLKKRMSDLSRLKGGFRDYGQFVKKRVDRLQISQWLRDIASNSQECPACGSPEHPNSNVELEKIASAFKKYEEEATKVAEIPTSFSREEERINSQLENLLEKKSAFQKRYDLIISKDSKVREEFQRRKNMFLFLGHLKASTETFESLSDGGDFKEQIELLEKEQRKLRNIADRKGVSNRVDIATAKISQGILKHLKTLDVDEKYRKLPPKFDINDLNISVLSDDEHWHVLAEVGSASNWVSFHLALMCSLQEYFFEQDTSCVPSFVIFDQPSQVYFPKVRRGMKVDEDIKHEDEDADAVTSMFQTISNSIKNTDGGWQGIILDHADNSVYGNIEELHEVQVWRDGNKLIPEEWYITT